MSDSTENTAALSLAKASGLVQSLRAEISKAVVGQDQVIEQVLIALFAGGHVLIEGVPGLGKTLLVRALAQTFNGNFSRIQFTPDLMPSDITGHAMYDMKSESFRIRRGPVFTNLLLADEINRAPAKTQAALLEVMQEQQVTIEGKALAFDLPFMTLATQNPLEQEGTYPLPEAQLDRFLLKVLIDYPSDSDEKILVRNITAGKIGDSINVEAVAAIVNSQSIIKIQQIVAQLQIDQRVSDYAVNIVRQTRNWPGIMVGAGPRGGISLVRAARAAALLNGNDFVTPDDIKNITIAALRHRIVLSPEMEIEGQSADDILTALLESVDAPRL
ncbi:MoxR-like ATPases [hydrothermal vent metagenome]|uniref:MoxR-like ATPases n=1 Tax=hydrothermal vent metagenome TaxID=652676 RepID=A0A3B1ADM0_9ZZZZ